MGDIDVQSAALSLGKLVAAELSYLDAVRGKVEGLKRRLQLLAGFLGDAVKHRQQGNTVMTIVSQARDVAYDCEDVIETYMLKMAHHKYHEYEGFQLGSVMRWACICADNPIALHQIGSQIDNLNTKISSLHTEMRSYGVLPMVHRTAEIDHPSLELRRFHSHDREEYGAIVGQEHDVDQLLDKLLNSDKAVIAISGMGGIGKTTLAIELYHHPQVRSHFKEFARVHLSRQLQTDRVLKELLYQLVPEENEQRRKVIKKKIEDGRAHGALYEVMKDFKCLVVIDDIWTSSDWAKLQAAFPRSNPKESKVLLTTRNEETVSQLDQHMVYLHLMWGLNEDKSWELFENTTFPRAKCPDPEKKKLAQKMLQHCRGVPLAITVLGKVLKAKGSVNEWKEMLGNISTQIRRGGAPNEMYREVYDVLRVSYDELQPSCLKYCFLHLANFPEDCEILAEKLFQLWVSEGIISKEYSQDQLEEDAAERCLNELVSRNMVQVARRELSTRRIETCRLHDLMRDICIDISKREGFLQVINCEKSMLLTNDKNGDHLLMTSIPQGDKRLRRLAVYVTDQGLENLTLPPAAPVSKAPNLRSLSLFYVAKIYFQEDGEWLVKAICNDFPLLRVFDCENFHIKGKLPKQIENLIHLRYMSLATTSITGLPSSIDKLLLLQTLDLRVNTDTVISLPNLLWKLKQLRHLYLPCLNPVLNRQGYLIEEGAELRLDGLHNLQTIVNIDMERVNLQGVSELLSMKTLSATCVTCKEALYTFLQLSSIKKMSLDIHARIINDDPIILSGREAIKSLSISTDFRRRFTLRIPLCLGMLPRSLVQLSIENVRFVNDPLSILEKLPYLVYLYLDSCYGGTRMVCTKGGFPELTELIFWRFSLRDWEIEEGALPKLAILQIYNCDVSKVPDALPSSVKATIYRSGRQIY